MRIIILITILQFSSLSLFSQEWVVPTDKKNKLSTFLFSDETRKTGERLFTINCMSCHGTPGKGNFLAALVPPPGDPATDKIQHNTDGEIFYKVSQGRGLMPSFKNVLSSADIWNIISYVRSFNKSYIQSVMQVVTSSEYPGAVFGITFTLDSAKDKIILEVKASTKKSAFFVKGAGVKLYVKRTFGQMMLDEEKITDNLGIAMFNLPAGLRGDTSGNITVSARFANEEKFGPFNMDTVLKAGIKVIPVSLTRDRALWNSVRKAPIWIILTFTFGVVGVWGFIFLALFKLRDVFIIGDHLSENEGNAVKENQPKLKD